MGTLRPVLQPVLRDVFRGVLEPGVEADVPGSSYETEAQAHFDDLAAVGTALSTTEKDAFNTWTLAGKANGWLDKLIRIWFWTHGNAAANAIDFFGNVGTFSGGGWTHAATYGEPNGSTDYFQTGSIPATNGMTLGSILFGGYFLTDTIANNQWWGAYNGTEQMIELTPEWGDGKTYADLGDLSVGRTYGTVGDSSGLIFANRLSGTTEIIRKSSAGLVQVATKVHADTGALPSIELYLGARNSNGSASNYNTDQIAMGVIGLGMTTAERTSFANETYTLLSALGV